MINKLLSIARERQASDLHIASGEPPCLRINGVMTRLEGYLPLTAVQTEELGAALAAGSLVKDDGGDLDFCYVTPDGLRQRVNLYRQRGTRAIALRLLNADTPTMEGLRLPPVLGEVATLPRGLVLVTGPTGSGKSTTLAAMVDHINSCCTGHILTIEDPVEYLHNGKRCIVNQREVGVDVDGFAPALRSALREDPDYILVGELRDRETIGAALTAAETGHLVMGTLHTIGAAKSIDRIIDAFEPHQQQQVRGQLATVLRAVVTQILLPRADGKGRVPAFEILLVNDAVSNLIRENKGFQINSVMQTGQRSGMILLDMYLAQLVRQGIITEQLALERSSNRDELKRYLA